MGLSDILLSGPRVEQLFRDWIQDIQGSQLRNFGTQDGVQNIYHTPSSISY